MKKLLALALALAPSLALAQNTSWPPPAGAVAFLGVYNSGAPTMTDKSPGFAQLDVNGNVKVNVVAGSGSGCAGTVGTPCVVAGPAASGAALSGAPVRVGMSDGTNAQNWLSALALGDAVNGNNTGAVANWWWNGTTWDRFSPMGLIGDTACSTDNGTCDIVQLIKRTNQNLSTLNTTAGNPINGVSGSAQSSSNPMGWVNINQTTPGTTNAVAIDQTTPGTTNRVQAGASTRVISTPTVQAAAYASGNCIGGINSITLTANNGQTGFLTNIRITSISGLTPTITLIAFDASPTTATVCTDKSTFTLGAADVDKMIAAPQNGTLAAPTVGTTITSASLDFTPPRPFIAGGSLVSGVKTIYYMMATSAITPVSAGELHLSFGAALN